MMKNTFLSVSLLSVLCLFSLLTDAMADREEGTIQGKVVNQENDRPVDEAEIRLYGPSNRSTKTNSRGEFELSEIIPDNQYRIVIRATGFATLTQRDIFLKPGADLDLGELKMTPEE